MTPSLHPVESEEVMAFLDGELQAGRAAEVAGHIEQCAECRGLAGELRQVSRAAAQWGAPAAPVSLIYRVNAAVRAQFATRRGLSVLKVAAASALSLMLIFAIAVPNLLRSRSAADRASQAAKETGLGVGDEVQGTRGGGQARPSAAQIPGRVAAADKPTGPMVIRTASLTVTTKEFENTRAATEEIVRRHQGYIAHLATGGQRDSARTLTATLRLPANRLDAALAELKKLGRLEQESQGGQEVTQQYVDLTARLVNARNTEQRLVEVLRERTGKVADILAVEKEIARVREEIERMDAERKGLENQVSFATVQLQVSEEHKAALHVAPPSTTTLLWNAGVEGYRGVTDSIIGLLIFALGNGPVILFWLLLIYFPARFAWKRLARMKNYGL